MRFTAPMSMSDLKRHLPLALIVLGLVILGYVATQYGQMYMEQRRLTREWQEQQQLIKDNPQAEAAADDGLTRLLIPKIELSAVVVEGTTHRKLLLGPGHMEFTAAPGGEGNAVITAHRDTFFRHIYELSKGDEMLVQRKGRTYKYEVTSKRIVPPTDISVVKPTKDNRLTLITCYPTYYIGPAPERLVITGKLVEGKPAKSAAVDAAAATMPADDSKAAETQ